MAVCKTSVVSVERTYVAAARTAPDLSVKSTTPPPPRSRECLRRPVCVDDEIDMSVVVCAATDIWVLIQKMSIVHLQPSLPVAASVPHTLDLRQRCLRHNPTHPHEKHSSKTCGIPV